MWQRHNNNNNKSRVWTKYRIFINFWANFILNEIGNHFEMIFKNALFLLFFPFCPTIHSLSLSRSDFAVFLDLRLCHLFIHTQCIYCQWLSLSFPSISSLCVCVPLVTLIPHLNPLLTNKNKYNTKSSSNSIQQQRLKIFVWQIPIWIFFFFFC